jgi:SpoVK/Ycf46/Vps4 family AAA+-type ATPase
MMKALANELKVEMITIKCSDIMSKWYGESENKVAELFRVAKERKPCIIFFDDLEAMAKHRDMYAGDDVTPRLLSIILAELDGMDHSSGIILVGTTNKPELIDPALLRPGRFDKIIYVPPPDLAERVAILNVHLKKRPRAEDLDLKAVAAKCERFSGADIANLTREAATLAMRRALSTNSDSVISIEDMTTVATNIRPSISLAMLENYELLKLDFERKMHHVKRDERAWAVNWNDVGGLDRTKKDIKDYIQLLIQEPEVLDSFRLKSGRGMLLFGPPGCGKKHIMQAAANNLEITIQEINATELAGGNGYGGPTIKDIFYRARESTPSIVLIEDIDVIGSRESIEDPDAGRSISQILAEFDNVESKEHILVIATTNRPQNLHPSLLRPGRFDKMFYLPPPVEEARKSIFRIYLRNIPLAKGVDIALLDELAARTEGYSSADLAAVVDEAKLIAVMNGKAGSKRLLTKDNLLHALDRVESSITPEDMESSLTFMKDYKVKR